jgi:hypothetical protein
VIQAASSSRYKATEAQRSAMSSLRPARAMVPVTTVPTGKVKLHQVSVNGIPRRAVRTVMAAAMASQSIANPHTGTPYSKPNTAAPAA